RAVRHVGCSAISKSKVIYLRQLILRISLLKDKIYDTAKARDRCNATGGQSRRRFRRYLLCVEANSHAAGKISSRQHGYTGALLSRDAVRQLQGQAAVFWRGRVWQSVCQLPPHAVVLGSSSLEENLPRIKETNARKVVLQFHRAGSRSVPGTLQ